MTAGSFEPSVGAGEASMGCLPVSSSGCRSIGSRVTMRGCGSNGYAPGPSGSLLGVGKCRIRRDGIFVDRLAFVIWPRTIGNIRRLYAQHAGGEGINDNPPPILVDIDFDAIRLSKLQRCLDPDRSGLLECDVA